MGTRSRIGIENMETGEVRSLYCHYDGYPAGVGQTLIDHYRDSETVRELIAIGYASSLDTTVVATKGGSVHQDEAPEDHADADAMYSAAAGGWEEWCYLYRQGVWFVAEVGGGAGPMLASSADPDGTAPADWKNLEGALRFIEPKPASYVIDPRQMPSFAPEVPVYLIQPRLF